MGQVTAHVLDSSLEATNRRRADPPLPSALADRFRREGSSSRASGERAFVGTSSNTQSSDGTVAADSPRKAVAAAAATAKRVTAPVGRAAVKAAGTKSPPKAAAKSAAAKAPGKKAKPEAPVGDAVVDDPAAVAVAAE